MSAPLLWIGLPGAAAALLFLLRRFRRLVAITAVLLALGLALAAWRLPVGEPIPLGLGRNIPPVEIAADLEFFGRRFILDNAARPALVFVYLVLAFWFGGAYPARTSPMLVPLGLGMVAMLTAALSVEPFLYAALLIEVAALLSVPLLSPPGQPGGRGTLRFITFQTLGMPFILFTSWLLTGIESNPGNEATAFQVTVLIGLGFAFLLAIFPFHTWIPMLAEDAHPYAATFVFFVLPTVVALLALKFLDRYAWLQAEPLVVNTLISIGALMALVGGTWAAFQPHLGRMLGYAVVSEIGMSLLAIGLTGSQALFGQAGLFFAMLLPRAVCLAVWAMALAVIKNRTSSLRLRSVLGVGRQLPVATISLVLAMAGLAGFPMLAGFPVRTALWAGLASQSLSAALLSLVGSAGLMACSLRALAVLTMGAEGSNWQITESWSEAGLLSVGWVLIFIIGLLPQVFVPALVNVGQVFGGPLP